MKIPLIIITVFVITTLISVLICIYQRAKIIILRKKLKTSMHNRVEIGNFLNLFSQNIRTMDEVDNWMNVTARYVADLTESQAVCVFAVEGDYLRAVGISGAFPPLHKTVGDYMMTKPKYILESLKRERIRIGEGIIGEIAFTRDTIVIDDASKDSRLTDIEPVIPIDCLMAVPLVNEGRVSGVICAVNNNQQNGKASFSSDQLARFKFIASQVVLAQNILQVYANLSEQQRINQELEFARSLQSSLLPESFPVWGRFEIHAFTRASKEVSGDFYDFVRIDDDRMLVVIGDACGKGIPACMIMSMTRSFIRSNIDRFTSLKDLLKELNENLFRDISDERYITLGACLLNKKESTLEYARAGHTELLMFVRNHIRSINPEGSALGLLPSELSEFDTICIEFSPDMSIMLFTDGVNEALNPKTNEQYDVDRIRNIYRDSCVNSDSPEQSIAKIMASVDEFADTPEGKGQLDDQTVVIIRHI